MQPQQILVLVVNGAAAAAIAVMWALGKVPVEQAIAMVLLLLTPNAPPVVRDLIAKRASVPPPAAEPSSVRADLHTSAYGVSWTKVDREAPETIRNPPTGGAS